MDTGAEVSVVPDGTLNHLELRKTSKQLCGSDRKQLDVLGELSVTLSFKDRSCVQTIYVVRQLKQSLLGLPAIQALHLLAHVDGVATPISWPDRYPALFTGLGTFQGDYEIQLKQDAKPFSLFTCRKVPLPMRKKVKEELICMESLGVISKVEEPTEWCAGMVVVPKKSGSVCICVNFRQLNESVLREIHPLPTVDETLAHMSGARVFSKLDANCGFWQIPLAENSRHLTVFITPFGRYHFNKLPFDISSAPEHFQRRMSNILSGHEGVLCHIDDVFVFGRNQQEHDARLQKAFDAIQEAGVTLNRDKCEFNKESIVFLGHVINEQGISPDPARTSAILKMKRPESITELRRFMGMVNQLGKFSPNLAEISQPLRELLSSKNAWVWSSSQEDAFRQVKTELTKPTVLQMHDPQTLTKISADASAYGLGAVILQKAHSQWKPVAYASRALTPTEKRYSQIEKEALAIVWACEKFSEYIVGKEIEIETDHKPLVPFLSKTDFSSLPPRILRFRLRLTRFKYKIFHVPGKLLYTADTLSRAPVDSNPSNKQEADTEEFVQAVVAYLPAGKERLDEYRQKQQLDAVCSQVIEYCKSGWPAREAITAELLPYWSVRSEISLADDLLLYHNRIIVPKELQLDTWHKIHHGHQGIVRCRHRISSAVWWPGVMKRVEELLKKCPECLKTTSPPREPLMQTLLPSHPWERVAADLCHWKGSTYLIVVLKIL